MMNVNGETQMKILLVYLHESGSFRSFVQISLKLLYFQQRPFGEKIEVHFLQNCSKTNTYEEKVQIGRANQKISKIIRYMLNTKKDFQF